MHTLPLCYFPSTVAFVDDSKEFLINFTLQFDDYLSYHIFESPFQALRNIIKQPSQGNAMKEQILSLQPTTHYQPSTGHQIAKKSIQVIYQALYNPQRFSEISALVVDYAMPGMNGIECCQQLFKHSSRKILLTGQADQQIAVNAFNQGLIHRYIQKNDPDIINNVSQAITYFQQQYFQHLSDKLVKLLPFREPTNLSDKVFISFFTALKNQHAFVEHYLYDPSGSLVLVNSKAEVYLLLVKTDAEVAWQVDMATKQQAPESIIKPLKKREAFLYTSNTSFRKIKNWHNFLIPATELAGENSYYTALLKQPLFANIQYDNIVSYDHYLDNVSDCAALLL